MLARMKPGSWLINVARGRLVDERALLRALRDGPLGGAVLDAFREEPLPAESPLYDVPNLIVTPHTSWSSGRVLDRSIELFCDNLRRFRPASRCSTWSTRTSATEVSVQIAIVGLPAPARPPSSTRSPAATPRRAASAA